MGYDPTNIKNSSSDSSENNVEMYMGKQGEPENGDKGEESSLMRTVSEYNPEAVETGEASVRAYEESKALEEGKFLPPPPPKYSIFSPELHTFRLQVLKKQVVVILIFWVFILSVWSIYWGSMYKRETRTVNLNILIGVEDDPNAPISQALVNASKQVPNSPTWQVRSGLTTEEYVQLVHDQEYWGAIYVTSNNVSSDIVSAFNNGKNVSTENMVQSYYETAKDPTTLQGVVEPILYRFESYFQRQLQQVTYPQIITNLSNEQFNNLRYTNILTEVPVITYIDGRPIQSVAIGPLQVGLIYMIIITFFQFMWMTGINGMVAKKIRPMQYIVFQLFNSQLIFLFISLAFTCLNSAFQIKMNRTWSGGFGVFWMISFLTMSAVGGANHNVALILTPIHAPLIGFWMLFFVMINISATFAPIPLCPEFFRFTYAMPIKNGYELMKICLYDTSHRHMGRYFGILIAWIAANNLLMPLCIMFFASRMKAKMLKADREKNN